MHVCCTWVLFCSVLDVSPADLRAKPLTVSPKVSRRLVLLSPSNFLNTVSEKDRLVREDTKNSKALGRRGKCKSPRHERRTTPLQTTVQLNRQKPSLWATTTCGAYGVRGLDR